MEPALFIFMNKTIIFISGWMVPKIVGKSPLVWDKDFWSGYKTIFLNSKTPTSDRMVAEELDYLQNIVESNPGCALAGQSLGAWWSANLALRPHVSIKKMVLWTPLGDANAYPIFNVTRRYHPMNQKPTSNQGPHRVLTMIGKYDLIVPPNYHAEELNSHFRGMPYLLEGGHFYQSNHKSALHYMKEWIET